MIEKALTTKPKDHAIIFYDKTHMFITKEAADKLYNSGMDIKNFTFEGKFIALANIAKILPIDEFYEQYPNRKPEPDLPSFSAAPHKAVKTKKAIDSLIRGYERGRIEKVGQELWDTTKQHDTLYQKMLKRQNEL